MEPDWKQICAFSLCTYKAWLLSRTNPDTADENVLAPQLEFASGEYPSLVVQDISLDPKERIALVAWCIIQSEFAGKEIENKKITIHVANRPDELKQNQNSKLSISRYYKPAHKMLADVRAIVNSEESPAFYRNAHCPKCNFKESCYKKLKEKDCLSLLPGMSAKVLAKYHSKGLSTITQISHLFRPRRRGRRPQPANAGYLWELKALAIRERKTFVIYPPDIEKSTTEIFIDFEGLIEEGWIYLIGIIIKEKDTDTEAYSYWANNKEEEPRIFKKLFELLIKHPDAAIYHYGSYESHAIKQAAKKWPEIFKHELNAVEKRMVNVLSYLRTHVYPPTFGNGLKEVAGLLGYSWQNPEADGVLSMKWRKEWETSRGNNFQEILLQYNLDDCLALIKVTEWLLRLGTDSKQEGIQRVADMKNPSPFKFKSNPEFGEDFNVITKASYFDYQQSKIYWRNQRNHKQTSSKIPDKKLQSGKGKPAWKPKRINEVIVFPKLKKCPKCGHKRLYDCKDKIWKWRQTDLKFTASGVKQWAVEYQSWQVKCAECWRHFNNGVVRRMQFGDNLFAWATNLYVNYHISHGKISRLLQEQFGIFSTGMYFVDHQHKWWDKWQAEVNYLWEIIRKSPVIHIDETTVKLSKDRGYVWVFATPHTVYYHFTLTREPDFLKEWLAGYEGIIVTDSFAGYEALKVKQQKCLIHLIRDLNDDLFKNPFDEEYKALVTEFGKLLRTIIETIDKYGLKRRHLNKHKIDVERFAGKFLEKNSKSGLYVKYAKRLKKHWPEIWTFLDYDGVPWNNNNAEAAAKAFAMHRRGVNGQIGEKGVRDYLKMLSIAQTCRYRKISFLDFLRDKAGIWENIPPQMLPGYLPFGQARLYIHKLKLKHRKAWREWNEAGKRPNFIPNNPDEVYHTTGWRDWYDWVGY